MFTISYDLNGGEIDGETGIVEKQFKKDTVIELPKPYKEGCTFDYWKGSVYHAGDRYTVTEDHSFVAQWKVNDGSGSDDGNGNDSGKDNGKDKSNASGSSRTGDDMNLSVLITLMVMAVLAAVSVIFIGRRKQKQSR